MASFGWSPTPTSAIIRFSVLPYSYDVDRSILKEALEHVAWNVPTPCGLSIFPNWVNLKVLIVTQPCLKATSENDDLIDVNAFDGNQLNINFLTAVEFFHDAAFRIWRAYTSITAHDLIHL